MLTRRFDKALWRLPRPIRKLLVVPVAATFAARDFATEGWGHAWPAAANAWRFVMDHVENRPC